MFRRILFVALCAATLIALIGVSDAQAQQQAYGQQWGRSYSTQDWNRFYHYPYVYYPQSFWGADYYRSSQDLYHRYPPEMQIPVYNRQWQNYYPQGRKYHSGHHFILDVF
ncbi:MAG: calmodulin-binding protein [Pirellulales bacterium]|nr:calmodulin-binding protein [Pirellulales bacterium]